MSSLKLGMFHVIIHNHTTGYVVVGYLLSGCVWMFHIYPLFNWTTCNVMGFLLQAISHPWTNSKVIYCGYALALSSCLDFGANKERESSKLYDILLQLQRAYSRQCEELKLLRKQLANRERRIRELEEQVQMLQLQQRKLQVTQK
jgi:hypothetical protein